MISFYAQGIIKFIIGVAVVALIAGAVAHGQFQEKAKRYAETTRQRKREISYLAESLENKRKRERPEEIIEACGGGALGAARSPDFDIRTRIREVVDRALGDPHYKVEVGVERFSEFTVTLTRDAACTKAELAKSLEKVLQADTSYIHEIVFADGEPRFYITGEAIQALKKSESPTAKAVEKALVAL